VTNWLMDQFARLRALHNFHQIEPLYYA
jgi:hypothetical protein